VFSPLKITLPLPLALSQRRTVLSQPMEANNALVAATQKTGPACPFRVTEAEWQSCQAASKLTCVSAGTFGSTAMMAAGEMKKPPASGPCSRLPFHHPRPELLDPLELVCLALHVREDELAVSKGLDGGGVRQLLAARPLQGEGQFVPLDLVGPFGGEG